MNDSHPINSKRLYHKGHKVHEENLRNGYSLVLFPTLVTFMYFVVKNFALKPHSPNI